MAIVQLAGDLRSGEVEEKLTDDNLDVPTTIAPFNQFIYAVNARSRPAGRVGRRHLRLRP